MSELRELRASDAEDVAPLFEAAFGDDRKVDAEEVRSWLRNDELKPEYLRVLEDDGRIVGYGDIWPQSDEVALDVAAPGHWEPFFAWAEEHARAAAIPRVRAYIPEGHDLEAFVEGRGYRFFRASLTMEIDLPDAPATTALPAGLQLRAYRTEDADAVRATLNEAFADDWNWHEISEPNFNAFFLEARGADPSLWQIAWDGDEIAGAAIVIPERNGEQDLGWIGTLGVRAPWRRKGLGEALLRASFAALYDRGLRRVGLGVDAENPTGALRLYERVGMRPIRRGDNWVLDL